jgi:hypothetical protein
MVYSRLLRPGAAFADLEETWAAVALCFAEYEGAFNLRLDPPGLARDSVLQDRTTARA